MSAASYLEEARSLHRRHLVVDSHCDSILDVFEGRRESLRQRSDKGHVDWPRALEGGLGCQILVSWSKTAMNPHSSGPWICGLIERYLRELDGVQAELATSVAGIRRIHAEGKLAGVLGIEGAEALHGDIHLLHIYYRLGVRVIGLVWNHRNALADGVADAQSCGGLTPFGRQVVQEMNRLGMVIDMAHLSEAGFWDVLQVSEQPVTFTHGNCMALWQHRRNLTDEQIRGLAEKGGVFGISVVSSFMGEDRGNVSRVADHIEHVIQVAGSVDHVAYGSDFDGTDKVPEGLDDVSMLPNLTAELLARGYKERDLVKIIGGNYLRVFEAVMGG